jgi:hypothetical protein
MEDCRFKLSEVCSCRLEMPHKVVARRPRNLSLQELEKYKAKLEQRLKEVNDRIKAIERKGQR